MLKKLLMLCVAVALSLSAGFAAAVEVNTADQAALESVKGIGPVHAKAILDERAKNGPFKNADDLAARVKGIGQKSVENLEAAGLTINGSSAPPTGAKTSTRPATKTTPAAPAATTAATTAAPVAAAPASAAKPSKSKKKDKAAASEAAAASAPAVAASAPADASGTKASKKKAKKSKAASAPAASGA
ncbi:ComEA family DNA-binding protein [Paraburkholderia sp. CI3]|uniref:ComEA family DNA-binding protein n=1 Tax=Paraburkholderia sp. CI3 TaxID=2991060 RepID=UPI003D21CA30